MIKKPTPGPRTIGKKNVCMCPRPGRLDSEAGPSGSNRDGDQGDDANGNDNGNINGNDHGNDNGCAGDRKLVWERPMPRMINSSGFYDPKPRKPKNVVPAGKQLRLTPMRHAPPPPRPSRDGNASVEGKSSEDQSETETHDSRTMSTFQRMLTPPVSDASSPPKKQPDEDVRVFINCGTQRMGPNKDRWLDRGVSRYPPHQNNRPDPAKQKVNPFNSTQEATKQKHWHNNSLPCIVENGSNVDADSLREISLVSSQTKTSTSTTPITDAGEDGIEGAKSPGNGLTVPTPPPSGDDSDSDSDIQDDPIQNSDNKDAEDLARLRQMLTPPVADNDSPPKKQVSEDVQVFMSSRHGKNKPNKSGKGRTVIKLPPVKLNPPNPDKQ
jgi:hypothetical protein